MSFFGFKTKSERDLEDAKKALAQDKRVNALYELEKKSRRQSEWLRFFILVILAYVIAQLLGLLPPPAQQSQPSEQDTVPVTDSISIEI